MPNGHNSSLIKIIDGRTSEGRQIRRLRRSITEALDRKPNALDQALIDRLIEIDMASRKIAEEMASGQVISGQPSAAELATAFCDVLARLGLRDPSTRDPVRWPHQSQARLAA